MKDPSCTMRFEPQFGHRKRATVLYGATVFKSFCYAVPGFLQGRCLRVSVETLTNSKTIFMLLLSLSPSKRD